MKTAAARAIAVRASCNYAKNIIGAIKRLSVATACRNAPTKVTLWFDAACRKTNPSTIR